MAMKTTLTLILAFVLCSHLQAQEADTVKYWKKGGQAALNFSQVSLTNWIQGGENSLAINGFLNVFADYSRGKSIWTNHLDLAYGTLKSGDIGFRKSDDKIDFASKYGYQAANKWYYSVLLNFRSQFAKGYNYPNDSVIISKFLAPAYVSLGVGMDYIPIDFFSVSLSPATGRLIIVNDATLANAGAFGVDPAKYDTTGKLLKAGKKVKPQFGALLRITFGKDIFTNVNLKTKFELYSDYLDHPENLDVYWDVFLAMKINKWLAANLNTTLIYEDKTLITDKEGKTGPRTQFKEVFGVGLTYMFP